MKLQTKRVFAALCALTLLFTLFAFVGCGKTEGDDASESAEAVSVPDESTAADQVKATLEAYCEGVSEGDRNKLKPGLPPAVPLSMGRDYDDMLKELLTVEQEKVEAIAGKGGKMSCVVNQVTEVVEDDFAMNKQSVEEIYGLTGVTAMYEAEIERVYTDASGKEVRRSAEVPLVCYTPGGWYVFMD